jgi:radical SAM protein with 4Fe4S-binding SPASM domain
VFINTISNSKSDVIDLCLWKYYLKYVLRIPGFGSKNEDSLNFGSFIHRIFELGYKDNDKKSLLKIAESERPNYKVQFQMNDRVTQCIENFILWNSKLGETLSTESEIEAFLDEKNDIKFIGIIDRIVKGKDGGILVIDYKTSKREKKRAELLDDKQLKGYAYAVSIKYGIPLNQIWCAHFYPVSGNFIPVQFSRFQIELWKKKEIDKVWRIRKKKKDEFPAQSNIFCSNCEMQPVCEKFCSKEQVSQRLDEQLRLKESLNDSKVVK